MAKNKSPLFAAERQQQIYSILKNENKVLITDLCKWFDITPPTARNDLHELEEKGLLKRTHGGAISTTGNTFETDFFTRKTERVEEKQLIARAAAELVHNGDSLIIDSGTTILEFAKRLCEKHDLTIVTCDLKVAMYLQDNSDAEVILLGGTVRKGFYCTSGITVLNALQTLCADICFLGTTGITAERGISTPGAEHAEIRRSMIRASSRTVILGDSHKIGIDGFHIVAPLSAIDVIVTDPGIHDEDKEIFEKAGVEVHIASPSSKEVKA